MTTQKWNANQELTTEERSYQAGTSDASKLSCAHLVETLSSPPQCLRACFEAVRITEPRVFHFEALQLLICAEIVFVVVDGHNGSSRVTEQESVNRGSGFRRIADAEVCQQHVVWQ